MANTAEIIAVGTELLLGNIANTNAKDLSQALSGLGIHVYHHTVVGDNPARLEQAVEIAKSRADIIITTGGLGPTYDDLTKETLAKCFGKKLEFHPEIGEQIRSFFAKRVPPIEMTENNLRQAYFPEGAVILTNHWGTAPGCAFFADDTHVIMLPGPPKECRAVFSHGGVEYLQNLMESPLFSKNIHIFGMGESVVESKLMGLMQALENPTLAPYAKVGEVMLRLTAKAENETLAYEMMEPIIKQVEETLGDVIYGIDVESLAHCVVDLLRKNAKKLAVAESCTGGLLGTKITDIAGASQVFHGGVIAYDNTVKENLLDVPKDLLVAHGAVSVAVAKAMAEGACTRLNADFGIGITGIAGPDGGTEEKPVGLVYVALQTPTKSYVRKLNLGRDRDRIRTMATHHAMDMLRRYLTDLEVE